MWIHFGTKQAGTSLMWSAVEEVLRYGSLVPKNATEGGLIFSMTNLRHVMLVPGARIELWGPYYKQGETTPVTHLFLAIYRGCFTSCIAGRDPLVIHGNSKYKTSLWWSPFSIIFSLPILVFAQFSRWTIHVIINTHSLLVCFKDLSFFSELFFSTLPWSEKWFTLTNIC